VWFIPTADERVGAQVKLHVKSLENAPYLSASAVMFHNEEALYQVHAPYTAVKFVNPKSELH